MMKVPIPLPGVYVFQKDEHSVFFPTVYGAFRPVPSRKFPGIAGVRVVDTRQGDVPLLCKPGVFEVIVGFVDTRYVGIKLSEEAEYEWWANHGSTEIDGGAPYDPSIIIRPPKLPRRKVSVVKLWPKTTILIQEWTRKEVK